MNSWQLAAYDEDIIDGKPRYRWYKLALNSVYMISTCDDKFDIDHCDFSDLTVWYDAAEWVAQNDPEALQHIMGERIPPVTDIVKEKLMAGLSNLGHFKSCAIVKKYLQSYPVPKERTKKRYLQKAIKYIKSNVVSGLKGSSQMLEKLKNEKLELFYDEDIEKQNALSVIVHIGFLLRDDRLVNSLLYMEWMRTNAPTELKEMFTLEVSKEIKDQLLCLIKDAELYRLYTFMNEVIAIKPSKYYFEIRPYVPDPKDTLNHFIDMDDD
ncbi:hypothetical protein OU798_17425 [Prolixibacteraceae bacterium Z1-6]|uniref:Uncharacterized protein n=1 Tax=Draconibacterium aestuarii TaxID=2998507 RepID=A0A9X3FG79_9BACT|nr:hypothetical protein [Prolixibacteraceae bacterium Z1-6]